ncbi:MAG: YnbE family lipoprotein [Pseudomonadota bacterium]
MHNIDRKTNTTIAIAFFCCAGMIACAPTVKMEAPQEPITINLNIKLDADIRVKLAEEAKKDIVAHPGVF